MIKKKTKLFFIEWVDSYDTEVTWEFIKNLNPPKRLLCYSVGWILSENKDGITIAPHISDVNDKKTLGACSGHITIPKVAIIKRIELKFNEGK